MPSRIFGGTACAYGLRPNASEVVFPQASHGRLSHGFGWR